MMDPSDIDLSDFLARWHGAPLPPGPPLPSEASWIPEPLQEWHGLAARWEKLGSGPHRMMEPSLVRADQGKAVFMEDSTGDWVWAFDLTERDLVYEGPPGGQWGRVPEQLTEFLKHLTLTVTIAVAASIRLGDQVPLDALPDILGPMQEIGFGGWKWPRPGYQTFMSDHLIASVGPAVEPNSPWLNREGYCSVRVAGVDPSVLGYLDSIDGVRWIELEFDDDC
ncbi:hypothetical protein ACWGH3_39000 [Streptomyces sp. NPDC054884]